MFETISEWELAVTESFMEKNDMLIFIIAECSNNWNCLFKKSPLITLLSMAYKFRVEKFWHSVSYWKLHMTDSWGHLEEHLGNAHWLNHSPLTVSSNHLSQLLKNIPVHYFRTHTHLVDFCVQDRSAKCNRNTGNWSKLTKEWRWICGNI